MTLFQEEMIVSRLVLDDAKFDVNTYLSERIIHKAHSQGYMPLDEPRIVWRQISEDEAFSEGESSGDWRARVSVNVTYDPACANRGEHVHD